MHRLLTIALTLMFAAFGSSSAVVAESRVVFACNYTISVSVDGQEFNVSHQDRVRDGSAIPFDFQDFLLELHVSDSIGDAAKLELVLSEKSDSAWRKIYVSPPSFETQLGKPTRFSHRNEIAIMDVSIVVSKIAL